MNTFELLIKMLTKGAAPEELQTGINWAKEEIARLPEVSVMRGLTGTQASVQVSDETIKIFSQVEHLKFSRELAPPMVVVVLAYLQHSPELLDLLQSERATNLDEDKPKRKRKVN